ncbi:MAG: bifunctional hydroxymethylpyrimidine kinase/phosphomethylpyrimidine kinase [Thermocrinis sp.]|nr:bifunctional hydroxymethylpyrimidine kinase/phosphomethylpyrimidine kinase [Thermocrinis sp.]
MKIPRALTIAGSDSSGGAGIQADLKTFTALGVYGMSAVTSITVQNTVGVFEVMDVPSQVVYNQIKVVVEDIGVDAVKTGMLSHAGIIEAVARAVKDFKLENLVVDPVLKAKSGAPLLKSSDKVALKEFLIPLATVVTPNIPEACVLVGKDIKTLEDMERACKEIYSMGSSAVLLKGGHMEGDTLVDVFYDGASFEYLSYKRVPTKNTHGTGCTLASAIAGYLAKGFDLKEAIRKAREYVQGAIEHSLNLGKGHGPLNHMWEFYPSL